MPKLMILEKKLKMGSVLWLIIPFYKLEKFSTATEA